MELRHCARNMPRSRVTMKRFSSGMARSAPGLAAARREPEASQENAWRKQRETVE